MNWELQLAISLGPEDEPLLTASREARERRRQGRYGPALAILWSLLLNARRTGSDKELAFVYLHMGKVYRHWLAQVAFKYFRNALELSREAGFARGEMVASHAIAELYRAWHEPAKALPHYERCLALARDSSGPWCERDVLVDLIDCLESLDDSRRCRMMEERLGRVEEELMASLWGEPEEPVSGREPVPDEESEHAEHGRGSPAGGGDR